MAEGLPLVYNIAGRALDGHADVDDVVQETLLRMVRGLSELRDPAAFRSWLVAITIRQVPERERDRAVARHRSAGAGGRRAHTGPRPLRPCPTCSATPGSASAPTRQDQQRPVHRRHAPDPRGPRVPGGRLTTRN
ncbi:RNA polymerase sigma factor [Actinacidiphila glaucinigra]|uniref:RNA polymerase sigma factor n=1 Tax=Actinacidiphila glaucinigra TaxID=235986 RepID=UPI003F56061F